MKAIGLFVSNSKSWQETFPLKSSYWPTGRSGTYRKRWSSGVHLFISAVLNRTWKSHLLISVCPLWAIVNCSPLLLQKTAYMLLCVSLLQIPRHFQPFQPFSDIFNKKMISENSTSLFLYVMFSIGFTVTCKGEKGNIHGRFETFSSSLLGDSASNHPVPS